MLESHQTWTRRVAELALRWRLVLEAAAFGIAFVALCCFYHAYSSKIAGGADAYGYVSEAIRLSQGRFYEAERVFAPFGLAENSHLTHPLGYVPRGSEGTIPTYPFGYPLLMAAAIRVVGLDGAFWVTPLLAAGAVLLTYALGRQLSGPATGVLAASAVFLLPNYSVSAFQPMSDVPATFFAALALVLLLARRPGPYGRLALAATLGVAIWIRPNMALLVVPAFGWLVWRREWRHLLYCCLALAPFLAVEALVNQHLYGQPWTTGYGSIPYSSPAEALARGVRHLLRLQEQQAGVGLVLVGIGLAIGQLPRSVRVLLLSIGVLFLIYFAFYPIDDAWWYGRFLLPGLPALAVLEAAGLVRLFKMFPTQSPFRLPTRLTTRQVSMLAAAIGLTYFALASWNFARRHGVFTLVRYDGRYLDAARLVSATLPRPALLLSMQHSGSLRFYADVPTTRYDVGDTAEFAALLQHVQAHGAPIYLLVDDWELADIRRGDRAWLLDGAQRVESLFAPRPEKVLLFRLADVADRASISTGDPED